MELKPAKYTYNDTPPIRLKTQGDVSVILKQYYNKTYNEWNSQKEAQLFFDKPNSDGIGAVCRGKQKTAYNYIWKFKN